MSLKLWDNRGIRVVIHGPDGDQPWTTDRPFLSVGSDSSCDLVIPQLTVQKAAYLHATGDGVYQCPLSSGLRAAGWLKQNDLLRLDGTYSLSIEPQVGEVESDTCVDLQSPSADSGVRTPILEVRLKSRLVGKVQLRRRLTVLGRHRPATVRLNSEHISSCHCVFYREGQRVWVVQLAGAKSTGVDGQRDDVAEVGVGQKLELGQLMLSYVGLSSTKSGRPKQIVSASGNANHYNVRTHQSEAARRRRRRLGRVESVSNFDGKGVLMAEGNHESSQIEQEVARCLAEGHKALQQLASAREHLRLDFRAEVTSDADGSMPRMEPPKKIKTSAGGNRMKYFDSRKELEDQRRELRRLGQAFAKLDSARRADYSKLAKRLEDLSSSSVQRNDEASSSAQKNNEVAIETTIASFRQGLSAELDEVYRIVERRFQERDAELQRRLKRIEADAGSIPPLRPTADQSDNISLPDNIALPRAPIEAAPSADVDVESSHDVIEEEDSVSQAKQQAEQLSLQVCDRLVQREQQSNRRSRLFVAASIGLIGVVTWGAYLLLEWVKSSGRFF